MKTKESIDLWTERGVPYAEVRARISERTDRDCMLARAWLEESRMIDANTAAMVGFMARRLPTTRMILELFEPFFVHRVAPTTRAESNFQHFLELHALATEAIVRDFRRNPTS